MVDLLSVTAALSRQLATSKRGCRVRDRKFHPGPVADDEDGVRASDQIIG